MIARTTLGAKTTRPMRPPAMRLSRSVPTTAGMLRNTVRPREPNRRRTRQPIRARGAKATATDGEMTGSP
jgi:hypothetical protein